MNNPVCWFEVYVDDLPRATLFYESVLGVELTMLATDDIESDQPSLQMAMFSGDSAGSGCSGALVCAPGMKAGNNSTLVYFSCDDCAVEGARVKPAGGSLIREKMAIGDYGFVVLAKDSEGNMIGFHSNS